MLRKNEPILKAVLKLIHDQEINTAKDSLKTLINISAEESGATTLLESQELNIVFELIKVIQFIYSFIIRYRFI